MKIFTKLTAGNIKLQEIGLLHYICGHLKGGIFDQSLPEIADATNFAVSTVHHFLGRLVECGFLKVVRPSVKTKTGNTPVGYQPIPPIEWGRFVDAKGSYEGDPIQKGMIHKIHSVCVCVEKECGMNLIDKGAIPPIEWAAPIDSAVQQVLTSIEHRREMAELAGSHCGRVIVPEPVKIIQPEPVQKMYNAEAGSLIGDAGQPCLSLTNSHCQNKPLAGRQMCQACEDEMVRQAEVWRMKTTIGASRRIGETRTGSDAE